MREQNPEQMHVFDFTAKADCLSYVHQSHFIASSLQATELGDALITPFLPAQVLTTLLRRLPLYV